MLSQGIFCHRLQKVEGVVSGVVTYDLGGDLSIGLERYL